MINNSNAPKKTNGCMSANQPPVKNKPSSPKDLQVEQRMQAGFALIEQNASGMGNAYAGGSAIAEDASTIFFNPAGMTYIEGTQAVGALHLIKPNAEFKNDGSVAGTLQPLGDEGL
ncbi:hypothetical protein GQR58_030268 [Nymphon striatum]|nr:hypothetical protein GQR58_030268 [Nymphon striatum]